MPIWVAIPLTIFVIVGVTNATNLSDGLDGLAGGMSLMILLCIGYLGLSQNDWVTTMIAIAVGGSVLGFLRLNSYPAPAFHGRRRQSAPWLCCRRAFDQAITTIVRH